jgi:hypothetical protein
LPKAATPTEDQSGKVVPSSPKCNGTQSHTHNFSLWPVPKMWHNANKTKQKCLSGFIKKNSIRQCLEFSKRILRIELLYSNERKEFGRCDKMRRVEKKRVRIKELERQTTIKYKDSRECAWMNQGDMQQLRSN